jgi:hypothetical protein
MMIDSAFIWIYLRQFVLSEFDRRIAHNPTIAQKTLSRLRQRSDLAHNLLQVTIKHALTFHHHQNLTGIAKFSRFSSLRRSGVHVRCSWRRSGKSNAPSTISTALSIAFPAFVSSRSRTHRDRSSSSAHRSASRAISFPRVWREVPALPDQRHQEPQQKALSERAQHEQNINHSKSARRWLPCPLD